MKNLKKIDEQTNVLTWFEIPVTDIDRAQKFYETILDIEMVKKMMAATRLFFFHLIRISFRLLQAGSLVYWQNQNATDLPGRER